MKIKSDFITNSSSTAYVVLIPNRFQVRDSDVKKIYANNSTEDYDEVYNMDIHELIIESIEKLKEGEELHTYGDDEETPAAVYYTILEICSNHGMIITSTDLGGEGNNTIMGIKEENVQDIMFNHIDMDSFFNTLKQGEDVCQVTRKVLPSLN